MAAGGTPWPGRGQPGDDLRGLMGLAMGFGNKDLKDADRQIGPDRRRSDEPGPVLQAGLKYVGNYLAAAQAAGSRKPRSQSDQRPEPEPVLHVVAGTGRHGLRPDHHWQDRLVRLGIPGLIRSQNRDGSWTSEGHAAQPDNATAFALLFFGRANLAKDLTSSMSGKVKDPARPGIRREAPATRTRCPARPARAVPQPDRRPKRSAGGASVEPWPTPWWPRPGPSGRNYSTNTRTEGGGDYTTPWFTPIPKLNGDAKAQARDALAHRCVRFTAGTLNAMMADKDAGAASGRRPGRRRKGPRAGRRVRREPGRAHSRLRQEAWSRRPGRPRRP